MATPPQTVPKSKRGRKEGCMKDPWKGKVADLSYPPYRKAKMEGKLPGPHPDEHVRPVVPRSTRVARAARRMKYWPERQCLSPIQLPELDAPIFVVGTELGLPELNRGTKPALSPADAIPPTRFPRVYLGDNAPTPRWLIRPVRPAIGHGPAHYSFPESDSVSASSGYSSASSTSRLPPLGRLRWEFEPGPAAKHGQDEARLREYAHRYLQNSLRDPIVREEMRDMIWNSRSAPVVMNVEDPLPIPPPPPHFENERPSNYVTLREPISASYPDVYHFMYPDYSRPSLAARAFEHQYTFTDRKSSVGSQNSADFNGSSSTSSSITVTHKGYSPEYQHEFYDDTNQYLERDPKAEANTKTEKQTQSLLSKPPKRGRGRPKKSNVDIVEVPRLNELSSAEPPRKKRAGVGKKAKNTSEPLFEIFSSEEDILRLKLPKTLRKKAATAKGNRGGPKKRT
ncbi:hypothetical protein BDW66DRAFT_168982 [Aspergillus desertorum]